MKDGLSLKGKFYFEVRDRWTGKVLKTLEKDNLVVTTGKVQVAKLIGAVDTTAFNAIAIGTGVTAPGVANSTLGTEVTRAAATVSYLATANVVFEHTFSFGSAESYTITEAGVFNNSTSAGDMLDRLTFDGLAVDTNTQLYVKVTITVT